VAKLAPECISEMTVTGESEFDWTLVKRPESKFLIANVSHKRYYAESRKEAQKAQNDCRNLN